MDSYLSDRLFNILTILNSGNLSEGISEIEDLLEQEQETDVDESMDGDHESALASAGFGTDEDYAHD